MGLFLQKTNITRDYREDIDQTPAPRVFYPRSMYLLLFITHFIVFLKISKKQKYRHVFSRKMTCSWARYGDDIADFKKPEMKKEGVQCVNHVSELNFVTMQ